MNLAAVCGNSLLAVLLVGLSGVLLYTPAMAAQPTITLDEVARGIQDATTNAAAKKVLEGLLNDYMDLQYGKETPYTTGKQVIPSDATIDDVNKSIADDTTEKIYKAVFQVIADVFKSGDLTPRSGNDGTWDPKFKPVLVLVTPNKKL